MATMLQTLHMVCELDDIKFNKVGIGDEDIYADAVGLGDLQRPHRRMQQR